MAISKTAASKFMAASKGGKNIPKAINSMQSKLKGKTSTQIKSTIKTDVKADRKKAFTALDKNAPKPKPMSSKTSKVIAPKAGQITSSLSKEKMLQAQNDQRRIAEQKRKADLDWHKAYGKSVYEGTNNINDLGKYNNIGFKYQLKGNKLENTRMQDMSVAALNGDKKAQAYLKAMHYKPLTGESLWKGYDTKKLGSKRTEANLQYYRDNPYAQYTKDHDMKYYNRDNEWMLDNKAISPEQLAWYKKMVKKWGLDDYTDPLQQNKGLLERDKKNALNAQDVALNNSMMTMDRNSMQQMQQMQQDMSNRGIADSGLAQDAYMRATMGNNANYQKGYADAATTKADLASQYDTQIAGATKDIVAQKNLDNERKDNLAIQKDKVAAEKRAAQMKQDQYLTTTSGYVYMNGKQLKYKGKPITTMEMRKLNETQRHNMAVENNVSNKNVMDYQASIDKNNVMRTGDQLAYNAKIDANNVNRQGNQYDYAVGMDRNNAQREGNQLDYAVGMDANDVKRQKIVADVSMAAAQLDYNYAKLDLASSKVQADIDLAEAKLKVMAKDASTKEMKARATSIGKQLASVQSQINAYIKKGKKPPKKLGEKLEQLQRQMSELAEMGK